MTSSHPTPDQADPLPGQLPKPLDITPLPAVDPSRGDLIVRALRWISFQNPLLLVVGYSGLGLGGTYGLYVLALATGLADPTLPGPQEDIPNLINFGIIMPAGAALVLLFYTRVRRGFQQILQEGVVALEPPAAKAQYASQLHRTLNHPAVFWLSLLTSLTINAIMLRSLTGHWNALDQGPAAWWFRVFTLLNIAMIVQVFAKSFLVVRAMRHLLSQEIHLHPLHPDGCGGLRSLGNISLSINGFVSIVAAYLSVLVFVGHVRHVGFIAVVLGYIGAATYLFLAPLARAHGIMEAQKIAVLSALNREFQLTYSRVADGLATSGISLHDAQKIESLERLHRIASGMPVWPIDTRIITQFVVTMLCPILVGIIVDLAT